MQIGNFILPTIWKQIQGYPNYEISICGQVRNFKTKRVLKQCINHNGYYRVHLSKNNLDTIHRVHRLVALNFIPNIDNKECVDHINNLKLDNTISNLRWCTPSENQFNRSLNKNNKSGYKGIARENNKWRVTIWHNNKKINIECFIDIEDAKNARQEMAQKLFGEFVNDCEK